MVIDLLIKNIKLLQHNRLVEGCISVENGRIYYIGKETHQPSADIIIDGQGYVALPGAVDIHVHFRDPGRVHKEDFTTGSMAAVAGGVTTVIDMPNTIPHTNTLSRYKEKKEIGEKKAIVDFSLHAGVSEDEKKLQELLQSNIPSIKVYMPKLDDPLSTLRYIYSLIVENNLNTKVVIHAEDPQIIAQEKAKLEQRKAKRDLLYHYLMRTPKAEVSAVESVIKLLRDYQATTHLCHISTRESTNLIRKAKQEKLPLTSECTPHHLLLSYPELMNLGPIAKCDPPLRTKDDTIAILESLKEHIIDIIASDHAPHTLEEKLKGEDDITKAPSGIVGVETLVPLALTLVHNGFLTLADVVERISTKPAQIFCLNHRKGALKKGLDADIMLVDLKKQWVIKGSKLHGKTKFTPFEGKTVYGKVMKTFIRGTLVYDNEKIIGKPGYGSFVYPYWIGEKHAY